MHKIILALGSNHEAKVNIELALNLLSKSIKIIQSTPSYDNESTEFPISIFTNKILVCETELSYEKLNKELKDKGYLVIRGKVPEKYFRERFYN